MARKTPQQSERRLANLNPSQKAAAIPRLEKRIQEVVAFNPSQIHEGGDPRVTELQNSIAGTLDQIFGVDTVERERYAGAHALDKTRVIMYVSGMPRPDHAPGLQQGKEQALSILRGIIKGFNEDLLEFPPTAADVEYITQMPRTSKTTPASRKIFIVHGHDDGAREALARFVLQLGFEPIILHEQVSQGRTVIEKVEAHGDVRFAVVLLTPDDEGCVKGGTPQPRARQNVLLELGYFVGRLGRHNVCALKRGDVEIPSDFSGVVYEQFDAAGGWKQALGRELHAAGFEIDWNKIMRP